jgi:hypothetical protein
VIATEAAVMAYIPQDVLDPDDVLRDGQGGVTRATYNRIVATTLTELTARLNLEGVESQYRTHALLRDVVDLLVAARICRRMRVHQETADSLFADANIKLRLFFEAVAGVVEGEGELALVGDDEPSLWRVELTDMTTAFLEKVLD